MHEPLIPPAKAKSRLLDLKRVLDRHVFLLVFLPLPVTSIPILRLLAPSKMPNTPAQTRSINEFKAVTGSDSKTATKVSFSHTCRRRAMQNGSKILPAEFSDNGGVPAGMVGQHDAYSARDLLPSNAPVVYQC